ncbi:MAG TPA: hypothetical protein V6C69_16760 [Trichormus sp.]
MRRTSRNQKGQGIIEGTIGVCMVIAAGALTLVLILNSGNGIFFKEKLANVARMAASYAASHASESDVGSQTTTYVQQLMPQSGMNPSGLTVSVNEAEVLDQPTIQVTVSNNFPLFGTASYLPTQIRLADTECVSW